MLSQQARQQSGADVADVENEVAADGQRRALVTNVRPTAQQLGAARPKDTLIKKTRGAIVRLRKTNQPDRPSVRREIEGEKLRTATVHSQYKPEIT